MTNFERVINLIADLGNVLVSSNDGVVNNMIMSIDTYDIYEDVISIGSLNGSEIIIRDADILKVDDNVVTMRNQVITFVTQ